MEYFTATGKKSDELDNSVNAHIQSGWEPFGQAYGFSPFKDNPIYCQPMIRRPKKEARGAMAAIRNAGRKPLAKTAD
jgi:hypothetical protein